MTAIRSLRAASVGLAALGLVAAARPTGRVPAAPPRVDPRLLASLTWRNIGPFRGGRISAVTGAVGQPGVFYAGLPAGGVLKTTNAGTTWTSIFDDVTAVSSVGAIEAATSNPDIVYAGTGDLFTGGAVNEGNGVYRSGDAGRSWRHVGLDSTHQIPSLLVDPRDADVVLAAAQGDPRHHSSARGVYRSTTGGATWTRTLFANDSTGVQKLARAHDVPDVVFATTVPHLLAPPVTAATPPRSPAPSDTGATNTKLYKSMDGGVTWRMISGGGLPRLTGRTSIAVAMHTGAQRVFLIAGSGLFRSDDGGMSWRQMAADDARIRNGQGGYNCGVYVDPQNPDVVYTINTSSYRSTDGGRTFTGFKGAPGGDDPQQLWIDPTNGQRMLMGLDQGAVATLDGGASWSSWYNQSSEQLYHLSVDRSFPYWVYGTQQDAGAIRTRARGNLGAITPLDWSPVPGWEWGTIVADPRDPNTVYSSGNGILRIAYPSEQWINVSPAADPAAALRITLSQPIAFAPWNPHLLIAAFQKLLATTDGGAHWTPMSGDLTLTPAGTPTLAASGRAAAIESMAASTRAAGMIWAGTNTGVIQLTRDAGAHWTDVSIAELAGDARGEVLALEASHTDAATAYAAVRQPLDYAPYFFRTHDFGRHWTRIVAGLPTDQPSGSFARVIREDPVRAGLLYAGTESGIYVSFDDGDDWQPLGHGLPTTSVRDLVVAGNDLVVATYGRGFYVLDDVSLLRQLAPTTAAEPAHLFQPGDAYRLRRNVGADTPYPPEVPHALNPADGVIVDYWLGSAPASDIILDVLDSAGDVVRHLTSAPPTAAAEAARPPHPNFWVAPPVALPAAAGSNRTSWDLHRDPPPALRHSFEINANPGLTPPSPEGALVVPGRYTLRLAVNGQRYSQSVVVRPDPRSPASAASLAAQQRLLLRLTDGVRASFALHQSVVALRGALRATAADSTAAFADVALRAGGLAARLDTVAGLDAGRARARPGAVMPPSVSAIHDAFVAQLNAQDAGDLAPTAAALAAFRATCEELVTATATWRRVGIDDVDALNVLLRQRGRAALPARGMTPALPACR